MSSSNKKKTQKPLEKNTEKKPDKSSEKSSDKALDKSLEKASGKIPEKISEKMPEKIQEKIPETKPPAIQTGLFYNRELSWLSFNERVLEEAQDKTNPVFERLKFLAITSSNMDEFFMVRVSGIMDLVESNYTGRDPSGMTPPEQLQEISNHVHRIVYKQYNCLNRSIIQQLGRENIFLREFSELTKQQKDFVKKYFDNTLYPILTPMAIDQSRPFPLLSNKSLNLIVEMEGSDGEMFAVTQVPSVVPRYVQLPSENSPENEKNYIFIENIIREYIGQLFSGYNTANCYAFRITRNSDLAIDEEDTDDLLDEIEKSIKRRKWGEPVRLEIEKNMSKELRLFLTESLELDERDIYEIQGPLDLTCFMSFSLQKGFDHLRNIPFIPQKSPDFLDTDMFSVIRERDILVHHPYESFDSVQNFVQTAASDPQVLAIKQTLYRVSGNSPIVASLIQAAENGKQVTVLVELKARFDEENNIIWAKKLEKSGCHVIYGLVGLKTHCKICLVVRREDDGGILRYIHLGTGNYNDSTAKIYTDMGYFTCRESFGQDISALFNVLTGYSIKLQWNKISVAPISLRQLFMKHINIEIENAKNGIPALIMAKMNSLVDTAIIQELYKASNAGVKIKLLVRGICCLKSGIEGLSENIQVMSIVDRFLEHSRIYYFQNNEKPAVYLASADWMTRNFDRRVEVAFPIEDAELAEKVIESLEISFSDTIKLRVQQPNGEYEKVDRRGKESIQSQMVFQQLAEKRYAAAIELAVEEKFRPVYHRDDSDIEI